MIWAVFAGCFLGRIGGATTFASAKVKDAIGRIGIFITYLGWHKMKLLCADAVQWP